MWHLSYAGDLIRKERKNYLIVRARAKNDFGLIEKKGRYKVQRRECSFFCVTLFFRTRSVLKIKRCVVASLRENTLA
jgi:hypothetical protein